jgi:hypothetical protein
MTDRFARALLRIAGDDYIVIIKTSSDYHELSAISIYHAEQKLHEFARVNGLILTEILGFQRGQSDLEETKRLLSVRDKRAFHRRCRR